jgi:hypothetical protein
MTSGAYRWDDRNHFPLGVSIQASIPLTRVFLSDGGAVAVSKKAWYRLVRIPVVVPLANPPRPSTSSHSAESETSDMGRVILVLACRQVPLPTSEKFELADRALRQLSDASTGEWLLSRRDRLIVAWHEVPGYRCRENPPRGRRSRRRLFPWCNGRKY